jgi:hypothetical protein
MNQTAIDYGQAQITAFSHAAAAGEIKYEPDVARQAAAEYQKMIIGLREIRNRLQTVADPQGFGGFQSSTELQRGFAQKTVDGLAVLNQLIEGAMTLQEAYLRSGNLITEADQTNAMLTQFVADNSELGEP